MADKILARRDTAANWTSVNPVLALGEIAFETDTTKIKFGDGATAWTSLGYVAGLSDADVRAAVEAASDSNVFTDNDHTKLDGIATAATVDQSDAEIATAYGNEVAQVSGGEITAGTETALRTSSPADIKAFVDEHGGGGGGPIPTEITYISASDYTLILTDAYKIIEMSSTGNRVLNIPLNSSVDFDVGVLINVIKILTGDVTVTAASGVTLNGTNGGSEQLADFTYSGAALYQRADNQWVINGALV